MNPKPTYLFLLLFVSLLLTGCGPSKDPYLSVQSSVAAYDQSPNIEEKQKLHRQIDSLEFRLTHHYSIGFNFVVTTNHITLAHSAEEGGDSCLAFKDDQLVVLDIHTPKTGHASHFIVPPSSKDSIWVKVGKENNEQGWISESDLLAQTIPDDSLSSIIDFLGTTRFIWIALFLALGLLGAFLHHKINTLHIPMVKMVDMDSFYPFLMIILSGILACYYTFILKYYPEYWDEYYFHPTLNPFILPVPMSILIVVVWLIIITFIALLIEIYHHFHFIRGVIYLLEIIGASVFTYIVIEWTAKFYIGYLLFLVLTWFLVMIYKDYVRCKYQCPVCGTELKEKGKCPGCGTILE